MMPDEGSEVERGVKRRRYFTQEFKRQVVDETLAGEDSVAAIALRHRLNTNRTVNLCGQILLTRVAQEVPAIKKHVDTFYPLPPS
jgi:hypothetical protein